MLKPVIREASQVARAAEGATEIYHLVAQVAVTTSVNERRDDLEINVLETFNVLEAKRRGGRNPFLLFTSTNKVYGSLHGVPVQVEDTRYRGSYPQLRGVTEAETLDFHSPYGWSKGASDQYVPDCALIYRLPTVVFRTSCIAGRGSSAPKTRAGSRTSSTLCSKASPSAFMEMVFRCATSRICTTCWMESGPR